MKKFRNSGQFKAILLIPGEKHGMWTVLGPSDKTNSGGNLFWRCQCECGTIKDVSGHRVAGGESKSCGCYRRRKGQNQTHGLRKHPLYGIWKNMKGRCLNPNYDNYPDYGGRGIKVCDRWLQSVKNFYDDVIEGYVKGMHLGRIDNDGDYTPDNCKWDTPLESQNNKRSNVYVTFDGRTHTPAEWGRRLNIKANTIAARIRRGRKDYEALFGDKPA